MIKIIAALAFFIALIVIGPIATIWAANTLFPALAIPYTWQTWAAVVLLGAFFRANVSVKKS